MTEAIDWDRERDPCMNPSPDRVERTSKALEHTSCALADTTSYGEKEERREVARVERREEELSCSAAAVTIAWHSVDLHGRKEKVKINRELVI